MVDLLNREYGFVYAIQSLDLIKVGVAKDIQKRMEAMRLDNPHGCELLFYRRTYAPYTFERRMHELLADKAVGREWFRAALADVRAASKTARLVSIRAERASRSQFKAAMAKPRKLAQCVNLADHALNEINKIAASYGPLIRTHDKERNGKKPNKSKGIRTSTRLDRTGSGVNGTGTGEKIDTRLTQPNLGLF